MRPGGTTSQQKLCQDVSHHGRVYGRRHLVNLELRTLTHGRRHFVHLNRGRRHLVNHELRTLTHGRRHFVHLNRGRRHFVKSEPESEPHVRMSSEIDKVRIPKLVGRSNWTVWKRQIQANLQYHDYDGVLSNGIQDPSPVSDNATPDEKKVFETAKLLFKKADGYAVGLLLTSVEAEPLRQIEALGTLVERLSDG